VVTENNYFKTNISALSVEIICKKFFGTVAVHPLYGHVAPSTHGNNLQDHNPNQSDGDKLKQKYEKIVRYIKSGNQNG
jgi:hypothetical protein